MLYALLRVLGGALLFFILAATVGIPAGRRGPVSAEPTDASGEPLLGPDANRFAPSAAAARVGLSGIQRILECSGVAGAE